ncbi:MAG TPA: heparan-alpha-glucosaminide N-acetyltransferase domain-containing protein [Chitinophagaceae bacterium]|nr:heparan-alpha-glucosaminide N-acetyltransferase domain-containing protein [Chitinophagaceae bacterium]
MATNDQNFLTTEVQRFTALDVFRGMTICFMIIVNTPGNEETTFAPLHHARWNGFTPTDLVFPSFMFAVGNAMSFVMRRWSTYSTGKVLGKIFKRTFIIFLLGFLMYWLQSLHYNEQGKLAFNSLDETRIFGVLQRIALGYMFASLMLYFFKTKATVIITILILVAYWPVLMFFGDGPNPLDIHTNAVLKLDTWLIGTKHLYMGEGFPFDPEGFLSTLPAIGNVVAGFVVGKYVQEKGKTYEGLAKIMLWGFVLLVIAHFWNYQLPINKKLWTSSFVLHTVGIDCLILSGVIYLIDFAHKKGRWTSFFETVGKNPLPVYLLSEVLPVALFGISIGGSSLWGLAFNHVFSLASPYAGSLLQAICYMLLCWSFGYFLDKKKIYIRV